jgi:diaminobutyrate-2-oxoglutarate transaminase
MNQLATFDRLESEVRSYVRGWPTVFTRAQGHTMWDEDGRAYVDLFAGAGALNYGHNHPALKRALLDYLAEDGVVHSLDMATTAKRRFLETFDEAILQQRHLDYRVQFPGPTGTNAVEAALKLARKVTGREPIISFTNAFHGMTLGSLALVGNEMKRGGGGVPLNHGISMPYEGFLGDGTDPIEFMRSFVTSEGSGIDRPAAIIVETVQGEGGIHVGSPEFLRALAEVATEFECLLIVDDVQMGCGRTGPFFSFEVAGIRPDIVCMSKSLSGYGLPLALTLLKPELDRWEPGEHNGTFRGHNPAFVTATAAIEQFWRDDVLTREVQQKAVVTEHALEEIAGRYPEAGATQRGRGLIQGLHLDVDGLAGEVATQAFERGVLVETSGPTGDVVKLLPPLTIEEDALRNGIDVIEASLRAALVARGLRGARPAHADASRSRRERAEASAAGGDD